MAESGRRALEQLGITGRQMAPCDPDVILMDLMMPVMDGKTMLRLLRDMPEFKTLPVLVLTNAGDIDNIRETQMYYGATDFLIKSNTKAEDIVNRVNKLLF